jgi:uncharacterized membrane protein YgdD (TMEM256/DUF423 family)
MSAKNWLLIGGVAGFLGVVLGAFGAHGIKQTLPEWYETDDLPKPPMSEKTGKEDPPTPGWYQLDQLRQKKLETWMTGVRYHFYHTFAILMIGLLTLSQNQPISRCLNIAGWFFVLGIFGFSGSIYLLVITKIAILGMAAAVGGVILLGGWVFFFLGVFYLVIPQNQNPASHGVQT